MKKQLLTLSIVAISTIAYSQSNSYFVSKFDSIYTDNPNKPGQKSFTKEIREHNFTLSGYPTRSKVEPNKLSKLTELETSIKGATIVSFELSYLKGDDFVSYVVKGSKLTPECINAISKRLVRNKFWIEGIVININGKDEKVSGVLIIDIGTYNLSVE